MSRLASLDPALDGLEPGQPLREAARCVLQTRLNSVSSLLECCADGGAEDAEVVHQLRVASRRAQAALAAFRSSCADRAWRRARRSLRRIRRAADGARKADVLRVFLTEDAAAAPEALRPLILAVAAISMRGRRGAGKTVARLASRGTIRRFRRDRKALLSTNSRLKKQVAAARDACMPSEPSTLFEAATQLLPELVSDLRAAARKNLKLFENLHELRLSGKRLRYAMEIFSSCITPRARQSLYPAVKNMQDQLGRINDCHDLVGLIGEMLAAWRRGDRPEELSQALGVGPQTRRALVELQRRYERQRQRLTREFLRWQRSPDAAALLVDLARATALPPAAPAATSSAADERPHAVSAGETPARVGVPRFAAIDVGTNSIRLVIAEPDTSQTYRIIDDEKETTRLGCGMFSSGRIALSAMKRSARAIEKMVQIAHAYHVNVLRAVGTSAVREARNGEEFAELVLHRAGVQIETITADQEARLAFASVSAAFDLSRIDAATVDIGGGSTEVIFSRMGELCDIRTLALGAVRLIDRFGGRTNEPRAFAALFEAVDKAVREGLRGGPRSVDVIFGTGGTFTGIAKILLRRGGAEHADRLAFHLRGFEASHSEVAALLDELRVMPPRERARIPGISVARSEIIVEGLVIVERIMSRLGAATLRIHDGGIRDGMIAQMIEEHGIAGEWGPSMASDRLEQVRRFAEMCRYDRNHAIQVARLALRIFDQLAPQAEPGAVWSGAGNRDLLHMAALLHDVGCCVEYRRHHRHSYDLIVSSGLTDFRRRELDLIANIARFHRRAFPGPRKRSFSRLSEQDQEIVRRLAAILRMADGLDRTHLQDVRSVTLARHAGELALTVEALHEPTENLRAAAKKSNLFQEVFGLKPSWLYRGPQSADSDASRTLARSAARSADYVP